MSMPKNSSLKRSATEYRATAIAIGGVTVQISASDPEFVRMLEGRYAGFIGSGQAPDYEFDVELAPPADIDPDADVRVFRQDGKWRLERGDFRAEWDPVSRRGGRAPAAGKHPLFRSRFGAGGPRLRVGVRAGKPGPGFPADLFPGRPGMGVDPLSLMEEMGAKALKMGIPLSVQVDVTYRCNERCVHCYLDHDDHGEMTTAEIKDLLDQLAAAGVFFLVFSGGEVFLRRDFFELLEYARSLMFSVKVKTNAVMIRESQADRLAELGLDGVQISVYSHRPEVHDGITKLPGSLKRTVAGARLLRERGVKVIFANVLMRQNAFDYEGVRSVALEMGAEFTIDPTITPMMDGKRGVLELNIRQAELQQVFHDETLVGGSVEEFCAPPSGPLEEQDASMTLPCSAGHT